MQLWRIRFSNESVKRESNCSNGKFDSNLFIVIWKWLKGFTISSFCFLVNDTKNDFLLIEAGTITPKRSMNLGHFGKLHCLLSKIMNSKQVLVHGLLEWTNDLRRIFVEHIHFKKYWNISLLHDQAQEQEIRFLLIIFVAQNHFKKGKYGAT